MEQFFNYIPKDPLISFTILLLVVLVLPPVFEKIRLPGLVGLLVAGIVLGKDGLHLIDHKSESIKLLSEIGKVYLMFVAGLEIDLAEFRRTKKRSLSFGFATFIIPLSTGFLVGRLFDYSWNSSLLIGSLLASHTLLAYPIVQRLGKVKNQAVIITIGATIFTDIAALLVLAVCVSIHQGEFTPQSLVIQLVVLAIYAAVVLFGFDWAGREYFRRTGEEESNQFLFILVALFLASVGAQILNIDKIVGAFLAGLAVNDVIGGSPVEEKVEFVGGTLFIPFFFVGMGTLLDIPAFIETVKFRLPLVLAIVGGLIISKFLAAFVVKLIYRYTWHEGLAMWSLSLPQVAATLAAALVAFQSINSQGQRLIDEPIFSSVIVLMLVTSIVGPILTDKYARKLSVPSILLEPEIEFPGLVSEEDSHSPTHSFTIVVPTYNPETQRNLIEMAALLARHQSGIIVPLSIAHANIHMDDPQLDYHLKQSQKRLDRARKFSQEFGVEAQPVIRIDDDVARGITRTAKEQNASMILMGWSSTTSLQARLFGNVIDSVFWSAHCPVAVMRLWEQPVNIHRLLVPVKNITPQTLLTIQFAQIFAETNQGDVTLFKVCDRKTSWEEINLFTQEMEQRIGQLEAKVEIVLRTVCNDDVAGAIIDMAQDYELVILRSMRRRTVGGLAVSDVTTELLEKLTCSLVLFGDPYT